MSSAPPPSPNPPASPQAPAAASAAQPFPPGPYGAQGYPPPLYSAPLVYPAPVVIVTPGQNTFAGLKWLRYGTIMAMVFNGLAALVGILGLFALSTITAGNIAGALGMLIVFALAILAIMVVGLVGIILGMVGYFYLHQGKAEFGETHVQSVRKSTIWFIVACVTFLANGIVGFAITASPNPFVTPDPAAVVNSAILDAAVGGGLMVVFVFASAMVMQLCLERLMNTTGRGLRSKFLLLSVGSAVASLIVGVGVILSYAPALAGASPLLGPDAFGAAAAITGLVGLVSIVSLWFYMGQIASAEQGARTMIATGRFDPDGAAATPSSPLLVAPPPAAPPM